MHGTPDGGVGSTHHADHWPIDGSETPVDDSVNKFMFDESEATDYDITFPPNELSNDDFSMRTPARAPRYLMQTKNSMNRNRTAAETHLRVMRRQHEKSEKLRTELVLRNKLDAELAPRKSFVKAWPSSKL